MKKKGLKLDAWVANRLGCDSLEQVFKGRAVQFVIIERGCGLAAPRAGEGALRVCGDW